MSFFVILSHKGWIRDPSDNSILEFNNLATAEKYPSRLDFPWEIIEVADKAELDEYVKGHKRTPVLNRSRLR